MRLYCPVHYILFLNPEKIVRNLFFFQIMPLYLFVLVKETAEEQEAAKVDEEIE